MTISSMVNFKKLNSVVVVKTFVFTTEINKQPQSG